ncbi:MAG: hypothetical protein A3K19_11425 [Lentisphaerae bacterium RIFOXYB12_FULL_65_16]|nr:MAG: hypothetical protein A3K18_09745 [Lentisphaerae bacterium RIFOXYA12_64_32]OGV90188.1 MAG: hypothetical protein A3K19_11425 [Lentisphaerae bacterium RIFOXYB12_FULL_65_16]
MVITIIAVLASFLMPALALAKERTNQEVCLNNLKQWSSALQMYVHDWDEYIPLAMWDNVPSRAWCAKLGPYVDPKVVDQGSSPPGTVGKCPSHRNCPWGPNYISYGWNTDAFGMYFNVAKRLPRVAPDTLVCGDNKDSFWLNRAKTIVRQQSGLDFRHPGGTNVFFIDGHAQTFTDTPPFKYWTVTAD